MAKVNEAVASRKRRKRLLKKAKGFRQGRSKLNRLAHQFVEKAKEYAFRDRRRKKRDFRRLWIERISGALYGEDISYSKFIFGLKKANISLNRKELSNLAIEDPPAFKEIVEKVKITI